MNKIIKNIIEKNCPKEEKIEELDLLTDDIEMARNILSNEYKYCPKCIDYYLTKSFITEKETKETKICTYRDPINSGGNDYVDGYIDIIYSICPKGHKYEISRQERRKNEK